MDLYTSFIPWLIVCGFLGLLGQSLRVLIGIKKQIQAHKDAPGDYSWFSMPELLISLLISIPVGVISGLALNVVNSLPADLSSINAAFILSMIAAGYAGTDLIEGLLAKYTPKVGTK
jgi:Na+/H+ antiporter NhaC